MEEIFKDIKGYDGLYQVSNLGKIKSLNYNRTGKEKLLKQNINSNNYFKITLSKNNVRKNYCTHVLVAKTFIENPNRLPCINHIDGNKQNNHIDNLEWVTYKQNTEHAYKRNLMKHFKVKVIQYDKNMNVIKIWNSITEASMNVNTSKMNIIKCCKGINKTAKGYIWKYLKEEEKKVEEDK